MAGAWTRAPAAIPTAMCAPGSDGPRATNALPSIATAPTARACPTRWRACCTRRRCASPRPSPCAASTSRRRRCATSSAPSKPWAARSSWPARPTIRLRRGASSSPRRATRSRRRRVGHARAWRPIRRRASASWCRISSRSRERVARSLARVMRPGYLLEADAAAMPFDISLGPALTQFPLVADALSMLVLAGPEIDFESASRLVRSPFVGGAEVEMDARARLDVRLRKRATPALTLEDLRRLAASPKSPKAPLLQARLSALAEARKRDLFGAKGAAEWARAFTEALKAIGFPGERTLDSAEYQTLQRWHQLLAEFATLEARDRQDGLRRGVRAPRPHGARGDLPARIRRRPGAGDGRARIGRPGIRPPVGDGAHRRGLAAAAAAQSVPAGQRCSAPRACPKRIPRPRSSSTARITAGWMRAAPEVVLSHARMRDDSELAPSPLIASVALAALEELALASYATLRDADSRRRADGSGGGRPRAARRSGAAIGRHRALQGPGRVPVPRLCAPPARRARARGGALRAWMRAIAARCCTRCSRACGRRSAIASACVG